MGGEVSHGYSPFSLYDEPTPIKMGWLFSPWEQRLEGGLGAASALFGRLRGRKQVD